MNRIEVTGPEDSDRQAFGERVELEQRPDGIAIVTLNNPPVNALTSEVFAELAAVTGVLERTRPGAVVLMGATKVFALGGEISEYYRTRFRGRTDISDADLDEAVGHITDPAYIRQLGEKYLATFEGFANLPMTTIAAISGITFGGGLELTLMCDMRIASARAKFAAPEVTLGGTSIGGGVFRATQLIGPSEAKRLYLGGQQIDATEAHRIGLVDEVVSSESLFDRAIELAQTFARYAGPAQGMLKGMINVGPELTAGEAARVELDQWCASYATPEAKAQLRAFLAGG